MEKGELEKGIIVFTDGSSLGNPGPGGWGTLIISPKLGEVVELGGAKPKTTNNEMELEAVIAALSYLIHGSDPIHIFTDSEYLMNGARSWRKKWAKNGWKTQQGAEVKNLPQWKSIHSLLEAMGEDRVHWHHLPSHVGIPGNERADTIAQTLARGEDPQLFRGRLEDYPVPNILSLEGVEEKRAEKRSGGAKAYSYLSLVDGKVERHENWAQCEARVRGASGAKYRKALSPEHEREILREWEIEE